MDLVDCPHCETRVVPMSTGQCPACRGRLDGPPDVPPKSPEPLDDWGEWPAPESPEPVSLATIRTYLFVAEAELARGFLHDLGIPAFLANAEIVAMNWLLASAVGYIRLQVPSTVAVEALELLGAIGASRDEREPLPEEESDIREEKDSPGISGLLDRFLILKRPMLWLFLLPTLLAAAAGVIAALLWLVQSLAGLGGRGRF